MAGGCLFQSMHKDAYHGILEAASNLFYLLMFQLKLAGYFLKGSEFVAGTKASYLAESNVRLKREMLDNLLS